jgi:hypothetical protein
MKSSVRLNLHTLWLFFLSGEPNAEGHVRSNQSKFLHQLLRDITGVYKFLFPEFCINITEMVEKGVDAWINEKWRHEQSEENVEAVQRVRTRDGLVK